MHFSMTSTSQKHCTRLVSVPKVRMSSHTLLRCELHWPVLTFLADLVFIGHHFISSYCTLPAVQENDVYVPRVKKSGHIQPLEMRPGKPGPPGAPGPGRATRAGWSAAAA